MVVTRPRHGGFRLIRLTTWHPGETDGAGRYGLTLGGDQIHCGSRRSATSSEDRAPGVDGLRSGSRPHPHGHVRGQHPQIRIVVDDDPRHQVDHERYDAGSQGSVAQHLGSRVQPHQKLTIDDLCNDTEPGRCRSRIVEKVGHRSGR